MKNAKNEKSKEYIKQLSKSATLLTTFSLIFPYKYKSPATFSTIGASGALASLILKAVEEGMHTYDNQQNRNDRGYGKIFINIINRCALFGFTLLDTIAKYNSSDDCVADNESCGLNIRTAFLAAWFATVLFDFFQRDHELQVTRTSTPIHKVTHKTKGVTTLISTAKPASSSEEEKGEAIELESRDVRPISSNCGIM